MKPFDIHKLIRPNIAALQPYRSARDDFDSGILLDANENSFGSLIPSDSELNRYPDPRQDELREAIAGFRNVKKDQVFVGSGSDEAIDLIFRAFCEPQRDSILITPPTYGMYKVSASINDNEVISVPLTPDFQLRTREILDAATPDTKVIFLCSPNNPTGNSLKRDDIMEVAEAFGGLVVVDEAYIDFSREASFTTELSRFPNLIVLQTLSKAFGMAGVRLGMAFAAKPIIDVLLKIKAPYNINKLTAKAGLRAFEQIESMKKTVQDIISEREYLIRRLGMIKNVQHIFPTDSNFILIRVPDARKVYSTLASRGVIVRYRGDEIHCEDSLRITVGTRKENDTLLDNLNEIIS